MGIILIRLLLQPVHKRALQGWRYLKVDPRRGLNAGKDDNSASSGGTLRQTPLVNQQGAGCLQRGTYFYSAAQKRALEAGAQFNW